MVEAFRHCWRSSFPTFLLYGDGRSDSCPHGFWISPRMDSGLKFTEIALAWGCDVTLGLQFPPSPGGHPQDGAPGLQALWCHCWGCVTVALGQQRGCARPCHAGAQPVWPLPKCWVPWHWVLLCRTAQGSLRAASPPCCSEIFPCYRCCRDSPKAFAFLQCDCPQKYAKPPWTFQCVCSALPEPQQCWGRLCCQFRFCDCGQPAKPFVI